MSSVICRTGAGGMMFQKSSDDYGKLLSIIPWIRHIFPNWSSYNQIKKGNGMVYDFMKALVDKHIESFDENHERNFIDMYIGEMRKLQNAGYKESTYHCESFIQLWPFLLQTLDPVLAQKVWRFATGNVIAL